MRKKYLNIESCSGLDIILNSLSFALLRLIHFYVRAEDHDRMVEIINIILKKGIKKDWTLKKMRLETLEHLMDETNEDEVVLMAFYLADKSTRDLRNIGIETDFVETIILKDKEYQRKDYLISNRK